MSQICACPGLIFICSVPWLNGNLALAEKCFGPSRFCVRQVLPYIFIFFVKVKTDFNKHSVRQLHTSIMQIFLSWFIPIVYCTCVLSYTTCWQVFQLTFLALLTSEHQTFLFIKNHPVKTYPCIKNWDHISLQYTVTTAWQLYLTSYTGLRSHSITIQIYNCLAIVPDTVHKTNINLWMFKKQFSIGT